MFEVTRKPIRVSPYAEHAHIESYAFDPQPDITTWELAQCLALIQATNLAGDGLADVFRKKGIERHFVSMTL